MVTGDEVLPGSTAAPGGKDPAADAVADEQPEIQLVSHLVFPVAGHGLFLDQQTTMEFLENQSPFYIPNNNPLFRGLINRRGSLVPVFDIRVLFDEDVRDRGGSRVLVLGSGDDAAGIILDATPYRVSVSAEHRSSPPIRLVQTFGEFLGESFERDGEHYTRVALEDFLYRLVHDTG